MANAKGGNGNLKNQLAERASAPATKGETVVDLINSMQSEIKRALPKHVSSERFARIALTAVRTTPKLQTCTPMSFIASLMTAAQLGLEPNTPLGQAYLIPYGSEAQFQLGYQGMLTLAYRTGEYKSIYAQAVYDGDDFEYEYGLEERLRHKPAEQQNGEPIYYYAVYHLQNGGHGFVVMSRDQVERHRDKFSPSASRGRSPWTTDFDSMAKKTVLKQLLKYAPKAVEFAVALSTDESVKHGISEDMTEVPNEDIIIDGEGHVIDDDEVAAAAEEDEYITEADVKENPFS